MIPTIMEISTSSKPCKILLPLLRPFLDFADIAIFWHTAAFDRKVSSCIDEEGKQVEPRMNLPAEHPWRILVCVHDLNAPDLKKTLEVIKRTAKEGELV